MTIEHQLDQRIRYFQDIATSYNKKAKKLSLARLIVFITMATLLVLGMSNGFHLVHLVLILISLAMFIFLIISHRRANLQFKIHDQLVQVNQEELSRKRLQLSGFDEGNSYLDEHHPYAYDLDIFGKHSIYQLLSRCTFRHSTDLLSKWLLNRANEQTIIERQHAVKELAAKIEFRQKVAAEARVSHEIHEKEHPEEQLEGLFSWMESDLELKNSRLLYAVSILMVVLNLSSLGFTLVSLQYYPYFLLSFFCSILILGMVFNVARDLGNKLNTSVHILEAYVAVLQIIESEKFDDPYLQRLKDKLGIGGQMASESINTLRRIVYRFSSRASMFYMLIDGLFMIDYYLVYSAFTWKKKHALVIHGWLDVVHEMEVLSSLAGHSFLNPEHTFPTLTKEQFVLSAKAIGHPLIDKNQCQVNDFESKGAGNVNIITGSNMSGKSTFERTLGVNLVLAQMGAPVCAEEMVFSETDVFTSMRTKDNLQESTSSFYAELKRIKQLLDHVETSDSTFYVLDEILKGTNSDDRHKGAIALANQLSEKKAFGLISTHDLALSDLQKVNNKVTNYSFNSIIQGDDIIFDYKLTDGPCKSFNASKLMEKMGIIVN